MFLTIFTRLVQRCHQLGKGGLCLTGSALGTLVLAHAAQTRAHGVGQIPLGNLVWASATALGGVSLEQLSQVSSALDGQHAHAAHAGSVWGALLQDV